MKNLVVVRCDSNVANITKHTLPIIEEYAAKCDAELYLLNGDSPCTYPSPYSIHYRIMEVGDLLNDYNRVLCIDHDIIITPTCPNLFDVVPYNKIGTILEDKGSRREERLNRLKKWKLEGYINTGVFLVSDLHIKMFDARKDPTSWYYTGPGWDDVYLRVMIDKYEKEFPGQFNIYELPYIFNHMSMYSESWNGSPSRFDSHIIHYAGAAAFEDKGIRSREQLIEDDIKRIYGNKI